jgi:hypothetical protein
LSQSGKYISNTVQKLDPKGAETLQSPMPHSSQCRNHNSTTRSRDFQTKNKTKQKLPNHPTAKTKCPAPATPQIKRTLKSTPNSANQGVS